MTLPPCPHSHAPPGTASPAQLFLARQWDTSLPDELAASQLVVTDMRCSTAAADACSWLATAEARTGRLLEAEAHHKAAAKAVEECGLVEACNRGVHQLQHHRTFSKDWAKHKALLKAVNASLAASVAALAAAQDTRRGDDEGEESSSAAAAAPQSCECAQDVLTCACAVLHERVQSYMTRGKHAKAAALACGPLLLCAATLEVAFPLRGRPGQAGVPLPPMPAPAVADMAAVLLGTAGSGGQHTSVATSALLRLRVGFTALALGWEQAGAAQAADDDVALLPPACGGHMALDARSLGLSDAWKTLLTAPGAVTSSQGAPGKLTWLPERLLTRVESATEVVLAAGDAWAPIRFNATPDGAASSSNGGARSKRGSAAAAEALKAAAEAAQVLSMVLLPYANVLMGGTVSPQQQPPPAPSPQERGFRAPLAARAARAAAAMCGSAKHPGNQGEALHMLGAALFYSAESAGEGGGSKGKGKAQLLEEAATAFAASADAKRACGAEAGGPCASAQEAQATGGLCESLLFLGKIMWDLGRHDASEDACARALVVARTKLGDRHVVTQKALSVMVDTKKKRDALASI